MLTIRRSSCAVKSTTHVRAVTRAGTARRGGALFSARRAHCTRFAFWARTQLWAGPVSCLFVIFALLAVQASEKDTYSTPGGSDRVGLSLRVLSEMASKAIAEKTVLDERCRSLDGIGFIEGFIVDDSGGGDVILVGRRSKDRPSLRLDDLIANMRSIAAYGGYPYCSLDPLQGNVKAIRDMFGKGGRVETPEEMRAFYERLKAMVGPQRVVVGGVPRNSRHAHVMIDADYHMKKVSQGHVTLPGVTSYLDRSFNEAKEGYLEGNATPATRFSMARFWFHVGKGAPAFREAAGAVWLDECPVVVLTEKQMASSSGQLFDVAQDDPYAVAFAGDMTREFASLARLVPAYADLENIFRLRALLLAMDFRESFSAAGFSFGSYIPAYRYLDESPMDPSLPGLANCREWSHTRTTADMIYEFYMCPMVFGGVGMDMQLAQASFISREDSLLLDIREAVLESRPSADALSWVVPGA